MNERIAEIMWGCALPVEEAKVYAESTGQVIPPTHVLNVAKFAELIVQKCADIGALYADGNYEVYNQIIAHFGVEE
jgi:hypothetical protein